MPGAGAVDEADLFAHYGLDDSQRLAKETVPDEKTVSGEVRKERIETEGDVGPQR